MIERLRRFRMTSTAIAAKLDMAVSTVIQRDDVTETLQRIAVAWEHETKS